MAAIKYASVTFEAESNNTSATETLVSGTNIDWGTLTAAGFANGDDVIVLLSYVHCTTVGSPLSTYFKVGDSSTPTGGTILLREHEENDNTGSDNGQPVTFIHRRTLVTNDDFFLTSISNGTNAVGAGAYTLQILRLDDLAADDFRYDTQTHAGNAPTSYDSSGAAITLPSSGGDDWAIWATSDWDIDATTHQAIMSIDVGDDGSNVAEVSIEGEDTAEEFWWGTFHYLATATASDVIRVDYRVDGASNYHNCVETRIFALRMEAFAEHTGTYTATANATLSVVNTYVEAAGISHTHTHDTCMVVAQGIGDIAGADASKRLEARLQESGTNIVTNYSGTTQRQIKDATDKIPAYLATVFTDATDPYDIDFDCREGSDATPAYDVDDVSLVVFSLELAAAADVTIAAPADSLTQTDLVPTISSGALVDFVTDSLTQTDNITTVAGGKSIALPIDSLTQTDNIPGVSSGVLIDVPADSLAQTDNAPTTVGVAGATYLDALNTDVSIDVTSGDVDFRLIYELQNDASKSLTTPTFKYRYSKNSGAYADIAVASSNIVLNDSIYLTNADDSLQLIGSGAFIADNNAIVDNTDGSFTLGANLASSEVIETELSGTVVSADVSDTDTIDIDIFFSDNTKVGPITNSARITVIKSGADTTINAVVDSFVQTDNAPTVASGKSIALAVDSLAQTDNIPAAGGGAKFDVPLDTFTQTDNTITVASGKSVALPLDTFTQTDNIPSVASGVLVSNAVDSLVQTDNAIVVSSGVRLDFPIDSLTQADNAPVAGGGTKTNLPLDSLTQTDNVTTQFTGASVNLVVDSLVITDNAPSIRTGVTIAMVADALTQTDNAIVVTTGIEVQPPVDSLTITDNPPTIASGVLISAPVDSLTITDNVVNVSTTGATGGTRPVRKSIKLGLRI